MLADLTDQRWQVGVPRVEQQLAARAATQRVERSTIEFGSPGRSVFGGRRETSGVGTILDLLVSLLD